MSLTQRVSRWGGARLSRRLSRTVPFLGGLIALATIGAAVRRKGLIRGTADSALNAVPFVGGAKLLVETLRGRDLLRDRTPSRGASG
jgi:hypothetical protein